MRKWVLMVFASCIFLLMAIMGCKSSEQRNIDKLKMIVEKAESQGSSYSEQDWEKSVVRFKRVMESIERSEKKLTTEQLKEIGLLAARMTKVTARYYLVGSFTNILGNKAVELSGFIEGMKEGSGGGSIMGDVEELLEGLEGLFSK